MARQKINYYVFTPGAANSGTVKVLDNVKIESILMITNVTKNTVIYNFGDPNRGAASVTYNPADTTTFPGAQQGTTTITLKYDTSTHSSTDTLQIYVEVTEQRIRTHDFGIDAVERQRVGIPRSMIDADFEYGLQTTKWAGFSTFRQTPAAFPIDGSDFTVNAYSYVTMITGDATGGAAVPVGQSWGNIYVSTPAAEASQIQLNVLNQGNAYTFSTNTGTTFSAITDNAKTLVAYRNADTRIVDVGPYHYNNDYKLIVNQGLGVGTDGTPTAQLNGPGTAVFVSNIRPITLANGGPNQRTFTVTSTANFAAGDIIAVVGLPTNDGFINDATGPINVAATFSSYSAAPAIIPGAGHSTLTANALGNAPNQVLTSNLMLAVEYGPVGSGTYELVTTSEPVSGATVVVRRNIFGTNPANTAPSAGGRIFYLGTHTAIETMRVDSIDDATTLTVTRGWFGCNANAQFAAGSIVNVVNFRGNVAANVEIVKNAGSVNAGASAANYANVSTTPNSIIPTHGTYRQIGVIRQFASGYPGKAFGTYPLTNATAGSLVINLAGAFIAGNVNMPFVVINSNVHGAMQFSTSNSNAYISTIGITGSNQNANVEGLYMNQLNDVNYIGYFPKAIENRPAGWPLITQNDINLRLRKGGPYSSANVTVGNLYVLRSDGLGATLAPSAVTSTAGAITIPSTGTAIPVGTLVKVSGINTDGTSAIITLQGVAITGTAGQFSCSASPVPLAIGQTVKIRGTIGGTGSISGYATGTVYYISATNGSTTFTLSTSQYGTTGAGVANPLTTTTGTPTGITYEIGTAPVGLPFILKVGASSATSLTLTTLQDAAIVSVVGATVAGVTFEPQIGSTITVYNSQPHAVVPGLPIQVYMRGITTAITNADTHGSGLFVVKSVPDQYTFTYMGKVGAAVGTAGTAANLAARANIIPFPTSTVKHRPLDGGTNIGINTPVYGFEATRQTRKYFRYQSGKGMMFTTGTQFNPVFSIANITANATSVSITNGVYNPGTAAITITTVNEHALNRGANITLYNINTSNYNDYYYVNQIINSTQFNVMAKNTLGATQPTFYGNTSNDSRAGPRFVVTNWYGAKVRSGMFDDNNGVFWEYDGQYLWAVKRSATNDLAGTANMQIGDNKLVGDSNSRFLDNVKQGDTVVLRGMPHEVIRVQSQNTMYVSPAYRGAVNAVNAPLSIVRELRTRSANFNYDRLDGTGPSGYVINLAKMQMVAIQFTWYGAGFIDYGMRTTDGKMIWAHRYKNNNLNDEGYMRSGNLPARYQAVNRGVVDQVAATFTTTELGNIQVYSIDEFPTPIPGYPVTVMVDSELITYTAKYPFNVTGNIGGNIGGVLFGNALPTMTVGTISGAGTVASPWVATVTGLTGTTGAYTGANLFAYAGTGTLYGGTPSNVSITSYTSTSITYAVVGGTTPTAGTVTGLMVPMTRGSHATFPTVANVFILGQYNVLSGNAAANGNHPVGAPVMTFGVSASPDLNHWGSAVILDGDFDVDRTYSFTYSVTNYTIPATSTQPSTLFMIRLAPSIGGGLPGDLGVKDVVNRAQLLLQNCYVNMAGGSSPRALLVGIVNPTNVNAANWQNVNNLAQNWQPSFTQFVANVGTFAAIGANSAIQWSSYIGTNAAGGITTAPGIPVTPAAGYGAVAAGATGVVWAAGGEQLFSIPISSTNSGFIDLSKVKEIGGSVIPGPSIYPNGPEVVAFNIVPVSGFTTNPVTIDLQLTWIESQA